MPWPDGVKATLQVILSHTYGRRAICPLSNKALAYFAQKKPRTISWHLRFLAASGQIRLEACRTGDRRSKQIVVLINELGLSVLGASQIQLDRTPDAALERKTLTQFKDEMVAIKKSRVA